MKLKGVAIQDLHFGIKDTKRLYEETTIIKSYLMNNEVNILNINGDYFDRKLSLNEPASFYALLFFDELVQICKEKKIKMRVIQGTRSHDLNQLSVFAHYLTEPDLDLVFHDTIAEEEIEGIKFLYIPEEYPENNEEYYAPYKKQKYSVIHGHGTFSFLAFKDQIEQSKNNDINTAPIFEYSEWKDALENGVAIFGHIHGRNVYGKKIYYSGSFTRWGFGERSERGFTVYEIDTETKEVKVEFVNNDLAPKYDAIILKEHVEDIKNIKIEDLKTLIDEFLKKTDNLRIDCTGLTTENLLVIKEAYKETPNLKIETKDTPTLLEANEEIKEAIYDKYAYILKKELPIDETIKRFAKDEFGKDLSLETIRKILS